MVFYNTRLSNITFNFSFIFICSQVLLAGAINKSVYLQLYNPLFAKKQL